MRHLFIFFALITFSFAATGQINWIYDKGEVQRKAKEEHKLIVMDFWAVWCGPCKKMDSDLWFTPEVSAISDKFVAHKVDIDIDQVLARQYAIKGIPRVIIVTPSGKKLWDKTGFGDPKEFIDILNGLPSDIEDVVLADKVLQEDKSDKAYFDAGMSYQALAENTDHTALKNKMLDHSTSYLMKARKKSEDEMTIQLAQLNQILNVALKGNAKKALKQLAKLNPNSNTKEFTHFVRAYCYKCQGDEKSLESEKSKITDPELLASLRN